MATLKGLFDDKPKHLGMRDMFVIRDDIEKALTKAGFEVTGAGTCGDGADITVTRDGLDFWIDIKHLV